MKKIILFIFYLGLNSIGQAQSFNLDYLQIDSTEKSIDFNSFVFTNSNSLSGKMMRAASGYATLTEEDIQQTLENAKEENTIGLELRSYVGYKQKLDDSSAFAVRIGYVNSSAVQLSQDAYRLGVYGNDQFKGDTAFLAPSEGSFYSFGSVSIGWLKLLKNNWEFSGYLNYNIGRRYFNADVTDGYLYTSERADTLSVKLNGDYTENNSKHLNISNWGASVDLMIGKTFHNEKNISKLIIGVQQFGFINYTNSNQLNVNYHKVFTGQKVDDPFEDLALSEFDQVIDEIDSILNSGDKKDIYALTPGNVFLQYQILKSKSEYILGVNYILNGIHKPYLFGQANYNIGDQFKIGGLVGFGGYAIANVGANISYHTNTMIASIGSQNLEGILLPNSFGGNNFYLNLKFLMP